VSPSFPNWVEIVNLQYRSLLKNLLAYVTGEPLRCSVDGPPKVAPFYFERQTDGAVIITLMNGYYDDLYDFSLVLGDGERLMSKSVHRVMPGGKIEVRPTLRIENVHGSYRLKIDRKNALLNCDCLVLVLK
jgi:hypothetical protein